MGIQTGKQVRNITCEWNTDDAAHEGEGIDPDGLLLAEDEVTAVFCLLAVVRVEVLGGGGGPH